MWTLLQTVSLGSLLLLGNQPLCAGRTRCIGEEDIHHQLKRFEKSISNIARPAGDLHSRSISPWKYKEDRNDTRYPHVIFMAECVHRGCIINGEETDAYNSVVVATNMNVFYKHQCAHDRSKHILTHSLITVPVSCTCVEPKY